MPWYLHFNTPGRLLHGQRIRGRRGGGALGNRPASFIAREEWRGRRKGLLQILSARFATARRDRRKASPRHRVGSRRRRDFEVEGVRELVLGRDVFFAPVERDPAIEVGIAGLVFSLR